MHPFSCRTAITTRHNTVKACKILSQLSYSLVGGFGPITNIGDFRPFETTNIYHPTTTPFYLNLSYISMILCLLVNHPSVIVGFAHKLGTTEPLNQHFFSGDLAKHWNLMISHFTMGIQGFLMDLATPPDLLDIPLVFSPPAARVDHQHSRKELTTPTSEAKGWYRVKLQGEPPDSTSDGAKCWGSTDLYILDPF